MNKVLVAVLTLAFCGLMAPAKADEGKHYNFGTRPHPLIDEETPAEKPADEAPKAEAPKEEPKAEAAKPAPVAETPAPTPAVAETPKKKGRKDKGYVYSPKAGGVVAEPKAGSTAERAEKLVRFFIGSCLKYYGRTNDMVAYMDATFPRLEAERKAEFAPVIAGNINTQYWDVVHDGAFYMLAKDTSSGKCDVVAKDDASTDVHKELKAVMDGLTITKILETKTEYERIPDQNKEVSIVNILGHPLEKELGIVATTRIKDTGDNVASILTLFTVPQETVEIK